MKFSIFAAFAAILQISVSQDDCDDLSSVIIKNVKSNLVLGGGEDEVTLQNSTGDEKQLWKLEEQDDGMFTITNKANGALLIIQNKEKCTVLRDALAKIKEGTRVPAELSDIILSERKYAVVCLGDKVKTLCEEELQSDNEYLKELCEAKKPLTCTAWQDDIDEVKKGEPSSSEMADVLLGRDQNVIRCLEDQAENFDPTIFKRYCNVMKWVGETNFRCEQTSWDLLDGYIYSEDGTVVSARDEDFTPGNGLELTEEHDGEEQQFKVICNE